MKSLAALACSALLLASAARADEGACAQRTTDTGFACMHLHNKAECEAKTAKFHGKENQSICMWTVATPPAKGGPAAVKHKPGCDFCGDPNGGFMNPIDAKSGKVMAIFKASKNVDASGACPAGWIRFGKSNEAMGVTADAANTAAKTSDVCK